MKVLRYSIRICLFLSILATFIYLFCGKQVGRLAAEYDLLQGRYEIHGVGFFSGIPPEIEELTPYPIQYKHMASGIIDDFIIKSVSEYNATMIKAVNRDLGIEIDPSFDFYRYEERLRESREQDSSVISENIPSEKSPFIYSHNLENVESYLDDLGDCYFSTPVELDGEETPEYVCLRNLNYKKEDSSHIHKTLILDLSKTEKFILRQGMAETVYFEEQFALFKDITADGRAELITSIKLGSDCSGCEGYRIYQFIDYQLELTANLFDIEPNHPSLKNVLVRHTYL